MPDRADIVVVGAGAAGLMAAIWGGRAGRAGRAGSKRQRVVAIDGASRLGAKVLVAGGGRCNVTHHAVHESDYAAGTGSSLNAVRNVLRGFTVQQTRDFFAQLGVELKQEPTGKLFPVTDDARTILDALLRAAGEAGVELVHPWRVEAVQRVDEGFIVSSGQGDIHARRIVLATGGKSLPKTGSDGHGYEIARRLGHSITHTFPALVPLLVDKDRTFIPTLSGIAHVAEVMVVSSTGKKLATFTDSLLCTHFGLSGPAALNISRYLSSAKQRDPAAALAVNWLPGRTFDQVDAALVAGGSGARPLLRVISDSDVFAPLPAERLLRALIQSVGVDPAVKAGDLSRDVRRELAHAFTSCIVPVTGDRGYLFAEVTAGGIPLSEVRLDTMESRVMPGLHLCGEILDVDGRIGGFNFQWAWATGFLAGSGSARLNDSPHPVGG